MKREHLIWILLGGAALVALYFFFTSKNTAASSAVGGVTLATPSGVNGGTPAVYGAAATSLAGLLSGLFGGSSSASSGQTTPTATQLNAYLSPQVTSPQLSADVYDVNGDLTGATVTATDAASSDEEYLGI